jgi:hypothetical protein
VDPEIEIDSDEVFYLHRVKDGQDFYFIVNPVLDSREINVTIKNSGKPELWNLENGEISDLLAYKRDGVNVSFHMYMQPYGSAMVSFADDKSVCHVEKTNVTVAGITDSKVEGYGRLNCDAFAMVCKDGFSREVSISHVEPSVPVVFADDWSFKANLDNVLVINNWKVTMDKGEDGEKLGYFTGSFDDSSWMDFRMGAWEMQLPEERDSKEYQRLIDKAYAALSENEGFRKALLATGDAVLTHSIGKKDITKTVLTEREFISRLNNIRKLLKVLEAVG